jgi:hypothetical protein
MQTFIRQDSPPVWVRLAAPDVTVARDLGLHAGAPSVEVDKVDGAHAALTGMLTDADRARRAGVGQCGP